MPELNPSPKIPTTEKPYLSPNPKIEEGKVDGGRETPVIVETAPKYENAPDSVQDEKLKLLEQRIAALESKADALEDKFDDYYTKSQVYTKAETDAAIEAAVNPQEPEE